MKAKLTVTIDEQLIPQAKRCARARGISLSQFIENELRELTRQDRPTFVDDWRGKFQLSDGADERSAALARKYL